MLANPTVVTLNKPELEETLLLYSPDENNAQRFSARLRHLVMLSWCDSHHFTSNRRVLDEHHPRLVLLDYSKGYADVATETARQLTALDPGIFLLGIGAASSDRGAGVLGAMRAGLKDFIDIDAPDEEILAQLKTALEQSRLTPQGQPAQVTRRGQLVLLCGVRPGLGASTLASHLAALSAAAKPAGQETTCAANNVLLLDLGHTRGDVELYLGTNGEFHFDDALRNACRLDATLMRTAVSRHASGAAVLGQPREHAGGISGEVGSLMERLLSMFDLVVCDLDAHALEGVSDTLLRAADEIWLLADQTVGAMVALDTCLHRLERARARDMRVSLIVNRHDEDCGMTAARMADRFNLSLLAALPERSRPLRACANRGALLHEVAPNDAYIRALAPLLARFRLRIKHDVGTSRVRTLINRFGGSLWKRH